MLEFAFRTAEEKLGITRLIYPEGKFTLEFQLLHSHPSLHIFAIHAPPPKLNYYLTYKRRDPGRAPAALIAKKEVWLLECIVGLYPSCPRIQHKKSWSFLDWARGLSSTALSRKLTHGVFFTYSKKS